MIPPLKASFWVSPSSTSALQAEELVHPPLLPERFLNFLNLSARNIVVTTGRRWRRSMGQRASTQGMAATDDSDC
jgi:hypothetical protein